jgi:WD40 repeat protein
MAEHPSRPGLSPRYSRLLRFLLPLVAIIVLLAGCGEGPFCRCSPAVTEHISAPNTRPITGLDRALLNAANGDYPNEGLILGLAPYDASDGTERLLAVLDGNLYALPTASGPAALIRKSICPGGRFPLSDAASRLACLGSPQVNKDLQLSQYGCVDGCFSEQLHIMSFTPTVWPHIRVEQDISDGRNFLSSPTWRPDGEAIAALDFASPPVDDISSTHSASCAIAVYGQASADSTDLVPALRLAVAGFSLCGALQVAWSPDGKMLAVLDSQTLLILDAPSPATIATAIHGGQNVKSAVTARFRVVPQQSARGMAWSPDSHSVAVVSENEVATGAFRYEMTQYSIDSSKPSLSIFGPDDYGGPIGPIAYSTDGRTLIFAAGIREAYALPFRRPLATPGSAYHPGSFSAQAFRPQICSCPQPPTGLYAYTLPTS